MKKIVTLLFLTSIYYNVNGQVSVGDCNHYSDDVVYDLRPDEFANFEKSTMVYTCRQSESKEEMEKIFKEVWNVSKFKVISYDELATSKFDNTYSFLKYDYQGSDMIRHAFLALSMESSSAKGKALDRKLGIIDLFVPKGSDKDYQNDLVKFYYTKAEFYNWNYGTAKVYLKCLNDKLKLQKTSSSFIPSSSSNIGKLKTATLYIPDYCLINFNTGGASLIGLRSQMQDSTTFFEEYKYKYQIISAKKLGELIQNSKEPIYYFVYVLSGQVGSMAVLESKNAEILYSNYEWKSAYTLKKSEFKEITKKIDKGK